MNTKLVDDIRNRINEGTIVCLYEFNIEDSYDICDALEVYGSSVQVDDEGTMAYVFMPKEDIWDAVAYTSKVIRACNRRGIEDGHDRVEKVEDMILWVYEDLDLVMYQKN